MSERRMQGGKAPDVAGHSKRPARCRVMREEIELFVSVGRRIVNHADSAAAQPRGHRISNREGEIHCRGSIDGVTALSHYARGSTDRIGLIAYDDRS